MTTSRSILQGIKSEKGKPPMLVVHIARSEQEDLDEMQGGKVIDPETGLRDYSKLDSIFRSSPEMRKIFKDMARKEFNKHGESHDILDQISSDLRPPRSSSFDPSPSDFNPEAEEIGSEGRNIDNDLAYFPESLADFFDHVRGEKSINPRTGLREYGKFWKNLGKIFRVAAPIIGAIVGSGVPVLGQLAGGMLGGALGGATGAGVSGITSGYSGREILQNVLKDTALGGLGGAVGHATGLTSSLGGATGLSGLASSMGIGSAAPASGVQAAAGTLAPAAAVSSAAPAAGSWEALKGVLSSPWAPAIAGAGLLYAGHKKGEKEEEEASAAEENQRAHNNSEMNKYYASRGFYEPLGSLSKNQYKLNPRLRINDPFFYKGGKEHRWFVPASSHAKGGHVKPKYPIRDIVVGPHTVFLEGYEKGQDDNLHTDVGNGSYIIDADTTAQLGDGNSKAGGMAINTLVKSYSHGPAREMSYHAAGGRPKRLVPSALSAGECTIPPFVVANIGGGDNLKGAAILKQFVKNVRKHKRVNINSIPPKSKSVFAYLPKAARRP